MKRLLERLEDEVLVADGAMGTMLMQRGMPNGACPDYWGIKNKRVLISIHKAYIETGADIIITNTFGANAIKLKGFKLQKMVAQINRVAVEIAQEAANGKVYVLGDIGPTGEYLKPAGNLKPCQMQDAFSEQIKAHLKAGVDGIILETMSDLEELKLAIIAVKEITRLPLIATMTFQRTKERGFRTTSGITIPQFVTDALLSGCDVIGANCSITAADMVDLISDMRKLSPSFLMAQPNAGTPKLIGDETVYEQTVGEFKEYISPLLKAGTNIIGGCCGTTPHHIRAIREMVDSR